YITNEEPTHVFATARQPSDDPRFREVPEGVAFTLRFPSGVLANCDCSFATDEYRDCLVHCADGTIEMRSAFAYRGLQLYLQQGKHRDELRLREKNHFAAEMDHFSDCVLNDRRPKTTGEEGLADMRVIEAVSKAIEARQEVQILT